MSYQLRYVTKHYGPRCVLNVESFDVRKGEILALVGPSGAGKSTLLRLLNFLEPPTSGAIRFFGETFDATRRPPLEVTREIVMVFQRPTLLNRSVRDNVAYGLRLRGLQDDGLVESTLQQVGLKEFAHASARKLSGGEAQRVALARAIILKPDVLLLDEPTANLDRNNVGVIEEAIRRIHREEGATIVLVTHNLFQARRLAQRMALMLDGQIVEVTDVEHFFNAPDDSRTGAFVRGDMVC